MNDELRVRTDEANDANTYLSSIVNGVSVGVVVVDDKQIVRTWNLIAEEMWGLRATEVIGRVFFDLDIGLPVDGLRRQLDTASEHDGELDDVIVDAINRRGRAVQCRVRFTPLHGSERPAVVMLIEEVSGGPASVIAGGPRIEG